RYLDLRPPRIPTTAGRGHRFQRRDQPVHTPVAARRRDHRRRPTGHPRRPDRKPRLAPGLQPLPGIPELVARARRCTRSARTRPASLSSTRGTRSVTQPTDTAPVLTRLSSPPPKRFALEETGKNRGRLCDQCLVIGGVGESGVPASVVAGEGVVEDSGAD